MTSENDLPKDLDIESHALGTILRGGEEASSLLPFFSTDLFYDPRHIIIADAAQAVIEREGEVDMMKILGELDARQTREAAGGLDYLCELESKVKTGRLKPMSVIQHLDDYRLQRFALKIRRRPMLATGLQEYEQLLSEITGAMRIRKAPAEHISESLNTALLEIDEGHEHEVALGLMEFDRQVGARRGDLILVGARTSIGKALKLDTPIATPSGWKTMGDIQVGDYVFGVDGKPTRVNFISEVQYDRPCVEVKFDDHSSVICDEDHLWETSTRAARVSLANQKKHKPPINSLGRDQSHKFIFPAVRTTKEISETLRNRQYANHSVRLGSAVEYTDTDLPIHPYIFGAWLGDGDSAGAGMSAFEFEMVDLLRAFWPEVSEHKDPNHFGLLGLTVKLKDLGVLKNKHIPDLYLQASAKQRWLLLAGLLDTDGSVAKNGLVEYSSCDPQLAITFCELACSLGLKIGRSIKIVKGRPGRCTSYRITFSPTRQVFLLRRKAARLALAINKLKIVRRNLHRTIVSVTPVPSVPVKCIQVEAPDHLYLITKSFIPTHNTVVGVNFCRGVFERGKGALLHSFEMKASRIVKRLLAHYATTENWKVQRGRLSEFEKEEIARQCQKLMQRHFWIRHDYGTWMQHLAAYEACIRMHPEIELLVVDYLGLIQDIPGDDQRHLQLGRVTRDLKALAERLNILVVGLAQFNRKTTEQDRPTLENFRESGNLEQDCDVAILLSAPDAQRNKEMGLNVPEKLILDVAKHRDGNVGDIEAYYDRRYCRITDWPNDVNRTTMQQIEPDDDGQDSFLT